MSWLHDHLGYTELLTNSSNFLVRGIFKGIEIKVACNKCIIYIAIKGKTGWIFDRRQSLGRRIRRSVKCTKEKFSMMNSDFNPNALNIRQFEIISAMWKYIVLSINAYSSWLSPPRSLRYNLYPSSDMESFAVWSLSQVSVKQITEKLLSSAPIKSILFVTLWIL